MTAETAPGSSVLDDKKIFYNRFLLIVAGLGGLLYGVDVGIIAGALPYLEATSGLNAGQLSIVVAAVLLGSVISTLFAGLLADWMGRRSLMALSGMLFVVSIPMIALVARLRAVGLRTPAARNQRGAHWRCRSTLSRRVSDGVEPRQRHRHFSMAAYAGDRDRRAGRSVFQLSRGSGREAGRCGQASGIQGHGLARNLLGIAAAGDFVCDRQLHGRRIAALAAASREERGRACGAASLAHEGSGRSRTQGDGSDHAPPRSEKSGGSKAKDSLLRRKYVIPVRAGVHHSGVQSGDRNQFDHRLQHEHSLAERAFGLSRRTGAMLFSRSSTSS